VLQDAEMVAEAVRSALEGGVLEVIAVDGGSSDSTREAAEAAGARVIESAPGRARQMNAGAAEALGEVLLFQHADTLMPPNAAALAREALGRDGVVAGTFGFSVRPESRHAQLLTFGGRWRARLTSHPHGDQCLFLAAGTFRELGGYPDMPTMEDWEFMRRLKRFGCVAQMTEPAVTSSRTWDEFGLVWPTALNAFVIGAYKVGVDPEVLAGWRRRIAPRGRGRGSDG